MKKIFFLCIGILFFAVGPPAFAQSDDALINEGIRQYQLENYEEAIEILEQARAEAPQSAVAAYFLGMAYKQVMDYPKALTALEQALTLKPAVREALVEYVNLLYRSHRLDEAKQWIEVGKKENIDPANMAFLEGLVLAKEKRYEPAVAAFEKAKSLDPKLAPLADYQIGLMDLQARRYRQAKERFRATVAYDATSDLAAYARQYQDAAEKGQFYTRPLRVTLGVRGGFDSNVVSRPDEASLTTDTRDPGTWLLSPFARLELAPRLEGPWLFNAQYAYNQSFHQHFSHSRDSMANSIAVMPGYAFGRISISLMGSYTNYLLKTDSDLIPDENAGLKRYVDYFTAGPVLKWMVTPTQVLEGFAGYDKKNYYHQPMTQATDSRDNEGVRAYLSWSWFFTEAGFLNIRYDVNREAANGANWDALNHRLSGSVIAPLLPDAAERKIGRLSIQLTGSVLLADYSYDQLYLDKDKTSKTGRRNDRIYSGGIGLNWDVFKHLRLTLEYTRTQAGSSFPVYEYTRNLYLAGMEVRF